jgi:serine/threonine protein kinase
VYRAYDPHLERDVALKVAAIESLDASEVDRYVHEARAAARLRHPRIVPVFEAGREGDYAYIASAYVPGETLADLAATGRIDPSEHRRIARIVRDVADALTYAHNLGIIHRDVKPSNILIDEEGKAHLLDFGLAVRREDPARSGEVAGTPQYLSPEVVRGERATASSDQYGLGIVLYFLLTGEPPFTGALGEVLEAIEETTPAAPHVITTSSPKVLSTACVRAIAKLPRDRYPDCRAFADSLRSWLKRDAAGPIEQFVGSLPEIDRFTRGMNRWRGATNLAAVFVGIAILSLLFYSFWEVITIVRTKESQLKARPTAFVEPVNPVKSP